MLLSNGEVMGNGVVKTAGYEDDTSRHWATYRDPWPKPCYLFAIVAGNPLLNTCRPLHERVLRSV